jgi:prepilin-type processing-associated H-X9-DG protein
LLPSLGKAREQSRIAKCAANMRGMVQACIAYASQNNERQVMEYVIVGNGGSVPNSGYPNGWYWATELGAQGYVGLYNDLKPDGTLNSPSGRSLFFCPDCVLELVNPQGLGGPNPNGAVGASCRDPLLLKGYYAAPRTGGNQAGDRSVYSWYQLNAHNLSGGNDPGSPGGTSSGGATPFICWDQTGAAGSGDHLYIDNTHTYSRSMKQIDNQSRMVAVVEATEIIWDSPGTAPTAQPRIRGAHGDAKGNGLDGDTNFAFFDGHVTKYSTVPFSQNKLASRPSLGGTTHFVPTVQDVYVYIQEQF